MNSPECDCPFRAERDHPFILAAVNCNWSGGLPSSTSTLIFGGDSAVGTAAGHVLNNDIVSLSIKGITFNAGAPAYTFNGNALTLTSNVTNSGTNLETINLNMVTTAVRTFTMTSGGGDILLGGVISGSLGGILTAGTGTLTLSGANTYTGTTTVRPPARSIRPRLT